MPTQADYIFFGIGILGAYLVAWKVPVLVKAASTKSTKSLALSSTCTSCKSGVSLESIEGIDLNALRIARQNGF